MHNLPKHKSGFTLIELMVSISVAAVVLGIAIPNFAEIIASSRLTTSANELVAALNLARSEAVKRGVSVTVRRVDNSSFTRKDPAADWEDGWDVFTDVNGDGNFDAGDGDTLIRTYAGLPANYTLRGNNNFVSFIRYDRDGISNQPGSFAICNNSDGNNIPEANTSRLIIVNFLGRVRMGADANNSGIPEDENGNDIPSCTAGF
ncbi:MAG: GspH/FimT family pseudopilin [Methylovulum sp.]|nr:GspH/FimT family pseudopilin [Methylovulum sp.]